MVLVVQIGLVIIDMALMVAIPILDTMIKLKLWHMVVKVETIVTLTNIVEKVLVAWVEVPMLIQVIILIL